ncbi:MAG: hypothetical protein KY437_05360 [Actinobacteria bacterium]|nr:hypothetical protein [Actinomycetota bacterium]
MPDRSRLLAVFSVLGVLVASCASANGASEASVGATTEDRGLAVVVASFDVAVGDDQRLLVGVFTPDRQIVGGGEVQMRFTPPGGATGTESVREVTGRFLPVPGSGTPADLQTPVVLGEPASHEHAPGEASSPHDHGEPDAAGVYQTRIDLDRAGIWQVTVTATLDGTTRSGTAAFQVSDTHQVPAVGEPAPAVSTPTLDSDLPPAAIDSRAAAEGRVPDEILHTVDLADALASGRPAVLVFATPTYCASRFCGPITDTVEQLAHRYRDRAAFVHVEIWRDIDDGRMNDAVEPWIATDDGGSEPWVFLVGTDGTITARWDNVLDEAELVALLEALPRAP